MARHFCLRGGPICLMMKERILLGEIRKEVDGFSLRVMLSRTMRRRIGG